MCKNGNLKVVQVRQKRLGLLCGVLLLCFALTGCDAIYRMLDKDGAEEKELVGELVPFESNVIVEEVQILLHLYGYNTGRVDGVLGTRTRNAIEEFQKDNGLEVTRFVNQETWARLSVFKENGLVQEGELNGQLVQTLLKKAGFDPGKIDGKIGSKTRTAVEAFQKAHELKVDGKIGYQTLSRMAEYLPKEPQDE